MAQRNALTTREYGRETTVPAPMDSLICPKPRRVTRPHLRWQTNQSEGSSDFKAGTELLDLIRSRGYCGPDRFGDQVASSPPPFFCGSPPSRVSNPVVQDVRFGAAIFSPSSPAPSVVSAATPASLSPSARKGGCARLTFGHKPATVRVEGFDCLGRDRQNCNIAAFA